MKNIQLIIIFLLTCLFIDCIKIQAVNQPSVAGAPGSSQRMNPFAVLGGLIGFGYLAYKLQQWFFWEPDENLIKRVENRYNIAFTSFYELIDLFEKNFAIKISDIDNKESILSQVKEQFLLKIYHLSEYWRRKYIPKIFIVTDSLSGSLQDLKKRIEYLSKLSSRTSKQNDALDKMIALENKINVYLPFLLLVRDYAKEHNAYFNLYDSYIFICDTFKGEIAIAQLQETTSSVIVDQLKQYIRHKRSFLVFVKEVELDIKELKSKEKKLKYNYIQLMSKVAQTINLLMWMRSVIMSDPRFVEEKRRALERRIRELEQKRREEELEKKEHKLAKYQKQMADLQHFMK